MGDGRGADVDEAWLKPERFHEVQQQLAILGALGRLSARHTAVAERAEQRAELALRPAPLRRIDAEALRGAPDERGAAELLTGGNERIPQVGAHDALERRLEVDEALERPEPILGPTLVAVGVSREAQPVALGVRPPILTPDVVLDDPPILRHRAGHEDVRGHAEAGDAPPLRLVPRT